jgi:hypothetical protein
MLGLIKNVGLEVGTLTKLFKLKKAIRESLDELRSLQVEVLKKYDVKPSANGNYEYASHTRIEEIQADMNKLIGTKVDLQPTNFMTVKELSSSASGVGIEELDVLAEILIKE